MDNQKHEVNINNLREQKTEQLNKDFEAKVGLIQNGTSTEEFLSVANSHDYPELLKIWLNISPLSISEKNLVLSKILEHENLHAIPALGKEELGIEVNYAVQFIKNPKGGVDVTPAIHLDLPEKINYLTPEGEEIALTILEVALNPVLVNVEQNLSEGDRNQIAKFLILFKSFDQLYVKLMEVIKKLPEEEQAEIFHRLN